MATIDWPFRHSTDDEYLLPEFAMSKLSPEDKLTDQSTFAQPHPDLISRQHLIDKFKTVQRLYAIALAAGLTITNEAKWELAILGRNWLPKTADQYAPGVQRVLHSLYAHLTDIEIRTIEYIHMHLIDPDAKPRTNVPPEHFGALADPRKLQQVRYWVLNK